MCALMSPQLLEYVVGSQSVRENMHVDTKLTKPFTNFFTTVSWLQGGGWPEFNFSVPVVYMIPFEMFLKVLEDKVYQEGEGDASFQRFCSLFSVHLDHLSKLDIALLTKTACSDHFRKCFWSNHEQEFGFVNFCIASWHMSICGDLLSHKFSCFFAHSHIDISCVFWVEPISFDKKQLFH